MDPKAPAIQKKVKSLRSNPAWKLAKVKLVDPLRRVAFETVYRGYLPLAYYDSPNWGDALSPILAGLLSGLPIKHILWHHQHRYLAIGSILGIASNRAEVWGSGFLFEYEKLTEAPQVIHAVRGPRSRARLLAQGIGCPEIYGDPALLFPYFFNPSVAKKYPIGIVPHYSDKGHPWFERQRGLPGVHILDVEGGIEEFVREVKSCERIVSSSLHGLICADAYGVPNLWVEVSDQVDGGSFKFTDYYESVGRGTPTPMRPVLNTSLAEVMDRFTPSMWKFDPRPLINACPFMAADVRRKLLDNPGLKSTEAAGNCWQPVNKADDDVRSL